MARLQIGDQVTRADAGHRLPEGRHLRRRVAPHRAERERPGVPRRRQPRATRRGPGERDDHRRVRRNGNGRGDADGAPGDPVHRRRHRPAAAAGPGCLRRVPQRTPGWIEIALAPAAPGEGDGADVTSPSSPRPSSSRSGATCGSRWCRGRSPGCSWSPRSRCRDTCSTRSARRRGRSRSVRACSRGTPRSTATSPSTATGRWGRGRCASSRSCRCWAAGLGWISSTTRAAALIIVANLSALVFGALLHRLDAARDGRRCDRTAGRVVRGAVPRRVRPGHGVRRGHRDDARRRRVPRDALEPVLVGRGRGLPRRPVPPGGRAAGGARRGRRRTGLARARRPSRGSRGW